MPPGSPYPPVLSQGLTWSGPPAESAPGTAHCPTRDGGLAEDSCPDPRGSLVVLVSAVSVVSNSL